MFFSVKELELKKVRFDVAFPPGEIDFSGDGLQQSTPLEAQGSAELLANTLGEIRIRGKCALAAVLATKSRQDHTPNLVTQVLNREIPKLPSMRPAAHMRVATTGTKR